MGKLKLIIDTDTGIDDAMGCVLALQAPSAEVLCLTSVFGNADVAKTTRNTAVLIEQLNRFDVPLARGASRGFVGTPTFNPEVHGEDGVGDADFADPQGVRILPQSAAQVIVDLARAHPRQVTFIGLGPLTNLALAILLEPDLPRILNAAIWMGGAIRGAGNVSPTAEADALHDPEAAQLVLDSDIDLTIVPLDVTDDTLFRLVDLDRLRASRSPAARYLARIIPFYMDFYTPLLGERACAMHSALTVGLTLESSLIRQAEHLPLAVELRGSLTRGMTVTDRRPGRDETTNRKWMPAKRRLVITDVARGEFVEFFLQRVGC